MGTELWMGVEGAGLFQSPRSGKFVSDYKEKKMNFVQETLEAMFQSPRSGKFVSDYILMVNLVHWTGIQCVSIP